MKRTIVGEGSTPEFPELAIPFEKVCGVLSMARRFDAKDGVTEPNPDSNPADDGERAVLEDHADDPVRQELATFIHDLDVDEKIDLVTLMRLGRGDGELEDWEALRLETANDYNARSALSLLSVPLLSDYLEEALSQFGESCEGRDADRL
jgi:hypothetical protein